MRAKTWKGLWGNLKFVVNYKTWAALMLFGMGVITGLVIRIADCGMAAVQQIPGPHGG